MSNEKNNNGESRAAKFFDEKGFYIVLILCVLAIGIAGYVFLFASDSSEDVLDNDLTAVSDRGMSVLPSASYDDTSDIIVSDKPHREQPSASSVDTVQDGSEAVAVVKKESEVKNDVKKESEVKKENEVKSDSSSSQSSASSSDSKSNTQKQPKEKTDDKKKSTAPTFFVRPVQGELLTAFSGDELVFNKTTLDWRTHNGADFTATNGEKVLCIADGHVEDIYTDTYYGTSVLVDHGGELKSVYTGLVKNAAVYIGQELNAGDVIGAVDSGVLFESGLAPHVHIEVIQNGERIDPMSLIEG